MEIILWIIGTIVAIPVAIVLAIFTFYILMFLIALIIVFFTGIASIPIAIAQRISGTNKKEKGE